jgi:hypothetical protein
MIDHSAFLTEEKSTAHASLNAGTVFGAVKMGSSDSRMDVRSIVMRASVTGTGHEDSGMGI